MAWAQVLAFDRDTEDFVLGFEAGGVFQLARRFADGEEIHPDDGLGRFTQIVHVANIEMMLRIAECHSLAVRSEELGDGWLLVVFTRRDDSEGTT